jgi:hypothetical protein
MYRGPSGVTTRRTPLASFSHMIDLPRLKAKEILVRLVYGPAQASSSLFWQYASRGGRLTYAHF